MKHLVALALLLAMACAPPRASGGEMHALPHAAPDTECVVLLHGLGRTQRSMGKLAESLTAAGYATCNLDYPSRVRTIQEIALEVVPKGLQSCRAAGAGTINFVTHSMGGLVLRYYFSQRSIARMGRVVMLSPPNQGSEAADALRGLALYDWINGPAGRQIGTGPDSLPTTLGPVDYPVGVITGNRHSIFDFWLAEIIPGEDDGKVSVERAKVSGMVDFLVLPYSHTFIMRQEAVIAQTLHFLRHGRFNRPDAAPPGKGVEGAGAPLR